MSAPEDKIVLNILLNCDETKTSETKQVHFKSLPTTPLEIKKKIEEDFSIPSCVQTLHYQSMILKDSDQLQHTHFRSGDTFTVDYPSEAECKIVQNVVKWLKELYELLKSTKEGLSSPDEESEPFMSSNFHKIEDLVLKGEDEGIIRAFSETLFKKKQMNHFYFQQEGGLDVLMKIYTILISKEWGGLGFDIEFHIHLERKCSLAICNYAHTFPFRRQIVQLGGLEMLTTTLLRRKLQGDNSILEPPMYTTLRFALVALGK